MIYQILKKSMKLWEQLSDIENEKVKFLKKFQN